MGIIEKSKVKEISFFFNLFENKSIPGFIENLTNQQGEIILPNLEFEGLNSADQNTIQLLWYIPDYIVPVISNAFKVKKLKHFFKGYAVRLENYSSFDTYLKTQLGKESKNTKRKLKRLEVCFNISYQFHYGNIDKNLYDFYLDQLEAMLKNRFDQRQEINTHLKHWNRLKKKLFKMVNNGGASIFVIKTEEKPVMISISYHVGNMIFSYISSYDINYQKFSLGSIGIYKKIEWCFQNQYKIYEMGMGDFEYKARWCDHIYNFQNYIVYPKLALRTDIKANKVFLKQLTKEKIFEISYNPVKKIKSKLNSTKSVIENTAVENPISQCFVSVDDIDRDQMVKIDPLAIPGLQKTTIDFAFTNKEHMKNINVYQSKMMKNEYFILGNNHQIKLTL